VSVTQAVTIDRMKPGDVPRVMEIEVQCFPIPWHESAYLTELSNRSAYYVVARLAGDVVGYAGLWIIMDESHITTIGVDPVHRGKKIGEQLLLAMLEEAISRGAHRVTLEVRERNEVAQNLYRKYGFAPAAIRRGYYTDNNENAIVMWISNMHDPDYKAKFENLKEQLFGKSDSESEACPQTDLW
jgi:[ribosomal protein S18]-alanine N-acetyltransferase